MLSVLLKGLSNATRGASSLWEAAAERTELLLALLFGCLSSGAAGCGVVSVLPSVTSDHGLIAFRLRCFFALALATWFLSLSRIRLRVWVAS